MIETNNACTGGPRNSADAENTGGGPMCTLEGALDELIEIAKELGEAESELAQYERTRESYSARTSLGNKAGKFAPIAKRRVAYCAARLATARKGILESQGNAARS